MERDFKWIRIPKEIRLTKELTLQEKIMYVELNSLDNNDWCTAWNKYFSEFFDLWEERISRIIQSLVKKWYILSEIDKVNGNKRIIRTKDPILQKVDSYPTKGGINNMYNNINIYNITEFDNYKENDNDIKYKNELYIIQKWMDLWIWFNKQELEKWCSRVKDMMSEFIPRKEDWKIDWNLAKSYTNARYDYWENPPKWKKKPTNFKTSLRNNIEMRSKPYKKK